MLYHWMCRLDPDKKGSLRNTHSELRGHWKSYTLQMTGSERQGRGLGLSMQVYDKIYGICYYKI